jgi:hypothetical protein
MMQPRKIGSASIWIRSSSPFPHCPPEQLEKLTGDLEKHLPKQESFEALMALVEKRPEIFSQEFFQRLAERPESVCQLLAATHLKSAGQLWRLARMARNDGGVRLACLVSLTAIGDPDGLQQLKAVAHEIRATNDAYAYEGFITEVLRLEDLSFLGEEWDSSKYPVMENQRLLRDFLRKVRARLFET